MFEKTYRGQLQGRSFGEMLSAGEPYQGGAAYAALESFEGTLDGKAGRFVLAHSGEMDNGGEELRIRIVPGSGTGGFMGLRGHMQIRHDAGRHYYTLTCWAEA